VRSFTLAFDEDGLGTPKQVSFEAIDPEQAFRIMEREAVGRSAILWEGLTRLGRLRLTEVGFWELTP
jgi:hypothetical protein